MDFVKLKERQKKSNEGSYILSNDDAENQVFMLVERYDIDLSFEIEGFLDEETENTIKQMSKEEKQGGIGLKTILKDIAHWIRKGVISIEMDDADMLIKHALINPIGEESDNSKQITDYIYKEITPKQTEKISGLNEDKYNVAQKAEFLMCMLAGYTNIAMFNRLSALDKRAARSVGILLLIAL